MRSFVPGFLLLGFLLLLSVPAISAAEEPITLRAALQKNGCTEVRGQKCEQLVRYFCREYKGTDSGLCNQLLRTSPEPAPSINTIPTITNEGMAEKLAVQYCGQRTARMNTCCAKNIEGTGCEAELRTSAATSYSYLSNLTNNSSGLKGGCEKQQEVDSHAATSYYGMGGVCRGMAAVCENYCKEVEQKLVECEQTYQGQPLAISCQKWRGKVRNNWKSCETGSSMAVHVEGQADKFNDGSYMAGLCKSKSEKEAGTSPEGGGADGGGAGDRVAETGPDGGGGASSPSSVGGGGLGQMGNAVMGMLPQLMQMLTQEDEPEEPLEPIPCTEGSTLAECLAQQMAQGKTSESFNTAGASQADEPSGEGGFNLPDAESGYQEASVMNTGQAGQPASISTIPNGGGGMAGGGGSASLGGAGGATTGSFGGNAKKLEITERSGGGYTAPASVDMKNGESGGGFNYGGGSDFEPMDLSAFLPGGAKDPLAGKRNLAGQATAKVQIQSANVNLWHRVSEVFKVRCSQGLLRDCVP